MVMMTDSSQADIFTPEPRYTVLMLKVPGKGGRNSDRVMEPLGPQLPTLSRFIQTSFALEKISWSNNT